jgi:hypothetical protein
MQRILTVSQRVGFENTAARTCVVAPIPRISSFAARPTPIEALRQGSAIS